MISEEIWITVNGFPYRISNLGNIVRIGKQPLRPVLNNHGYLCVTLYGETGCRQFRIHRLVATYFVRLKTGKAFQVNHIDGNKLNNRADNLEWVTAKENIHHAMKLGLRHPVGGERSGMAKLTNRQATKIRALYQKGTPVKRIVTLFPIKESQVYSILANRSYK